MACTFYSHMMICLCSGDCWALLYILLTDRVSKAICNITSSTDCGSFPLNLWLNHMLGHWFQKYILKGASGGTWGLNKETNS